MVYRRVNSGIMVFTPGYRSGKTGSLIFEIKKFRELSTDETLTLMLKLLALAKALCKFGIKKQTDTKKGIL